MEKYVSKQDCFKKGFVRGDDGLFRKLNTLERYGKEGCLDLGDKRYSATDRISAGNRLGRDFYLSRLEPVCANDIRKVKVDGCGSQALSSAILDARNRFNKACNAVPREFWRVVSRVCCEDREFDVAEGSLRQKSYHRNNMKLLLCLGLDRLIEHYRHKIKEK